MDLLTETILPIIKEEMGIADEVNSIVSNFSNMLYTALTERKHEFVKFDRGGRKLSGAYNASTDWAKITVNWELYDFASQEWANSYPNITDEASCEKTVDGFIIRLKIKSINGKINNARYLESLQHEISHAWELHCRKTRYKSMDLYNFGQKLMNEHKNTYSFIVGFILYLSKTFEVRAYSNGAYRYLVSCENPLQLNKNAKETQLYHAIDVVKYAVDVLSGISVSQYNNALGDYSSMLIGTFKLTKEKIIKIGEDVVDNMIRALGRAMIKAEKDIKDSYGLNKPYLFREDGRLCVLMRNLIFENKIIDLK